MRLPNLYSTLLVNSISSAGLGLALVAAPASLSAIMGEVPQWLCQAVGAGLLIFALDVLWVALRLPDSRRFVAWILVADIAWVGGTPLVMLAFADQLSLWGQLLLLGVGSLVAGFAFLEWYWTRARAAEKNSAGSPISMV